MPDGKTQNFPGREHAIRSPLAMRLFEIEGIESAFFGSDFVSVNKVRIIFLFFFFTLNQFCKIILC